MPREARLARNEALFREVNERIAELAENFADDFHVVCECAATGCQTMLAIPLDDYRRVREHPLRFIVATGHIDPDIENLVERHDTYDVVEKHPDVIPVLESV